MSTFTNRAGGIGDFMAELNNYGVKFFVLPHLEKTFLDGAAFYDGGNPVIIIGALAHINTISYKNIHLYNDNVLEMIPERYLHESVVV